MKRAINLTMMSFGVFFVLIGMAWATPAIAETLQAEAQLYNGLGVEIGRVLFSQEAGVPGVRIVVEINNMPEGVYSLNIHDTGQCESPDFKSAGGYLDPAGPEPVSADPPGPRAGELPNIVVGGDGQGRMAITTNQVTLEEGAANDLLRPGGTSVIVHPGVGKDLAGYGEVRIACGVIKESAL